jgi:preprotein translocase subunit YajC
MIELGFAPWPAPSWFAQSGHLHAWLAQAGAPAPNPLFQLLPLVLVFVIFWFVLIQPMRRRQKKLQELIENLKRGDRVITNGGLYGEVSAVEGSVIHLKIADNTRVKVAKSAIAGLQEEPDGGAS